ncbi:hypothetical protein IWQ60_010915 [Tieghemiomyces parasiticus]|uniref:E3 ubiquitin-protein ligase CHIP n=1 Tax=Tieghemiomyces parasiticus TaxID=78921 RepID=A0A9W7ZPC8_9FUNG|nr:hypothetical protein IWQ60_010915 [Tieghemiomyces parasiticus]
MSYIAEHHKRSGNNFFAQGKFETAITEYTKAILHRYDEAGQDSRQAVDINDQSTKGHFFLGQALTQLGNRHDEALIHLLRAYRLCQENRQSYRFAADIVTKIQLVKKLRWQALEVERIEKQSQTLAFVKALIQDHFDEKRHLLTQNYKELKDQEEVQSEIESEENVYLSQVMQVFGQADANLAVREVPECYCDKITFNIMHDPVITPSGISYERSSLLEHLKRIGPYDPLTRLKMTDKDLVPNLALKEAIEDFVSK